MSAAYKAQKPELQAVVACVYKFPCVSSPLTVWWELVLLEHSDAQDVLVEVFDEELAVEVPLWVQSVADRSGRVALSPHRQLTVRIALTCGGEWYALLN